MGRRTDLLRDDPIYATVEYYLPKGVTQAKAFEWTATEYLPDDKKEKSYTVKSIWLRHRKRITKWVYGGSLEWGFKPEYIRHDKNAAMAEVPDWLKNTKK